MIKRMNQMLRCRKGVIHIIPELFWGVCALLTVVNLSVPSIKDNFRERKAEEICYCMEDGGTEGSCKALTKIEVEEGETLNACKQMVSTMDNQEILDYIRDDVMPGDNANNFAEILNTDEVIIEMEVVENNI